MQNFDAPYFSLDNPVVRSLLWALLGVLANSVFIGAVWVVQGFVPEIDGLRLTKSVSINIPISGWFNVGIGLVAGLTIHAKTIARIPNKQFFSVIAIALCLNIFLDSGNVEERMLILALVHAIVAVLVLGMLRNSILMTRQEWGFYAVYGLFTSAWLGGMTMSVYVTGLVICIFAFIGGLAVLFFVLTKRELHTEDPPL